MSENFKPNKLVMAYLNMKAKGIKRVKGNINFRFAKNFLLVYHLNENDSNQLFEIQNLTEYLEQNGKTVISVVIYPGKDTKNIPVPADRNRWNFCMSDFNRFGYPKADGLLRVLKQQTDFFINLDLDFSYKSIAMANLSSAYAKVSNFQDNYPAFFDILLKQPETPNLNQYLCDLKDCFKHIQ
jgi:hypothetical protein